MNQTINSKLALLISLWLSCTTLFGQQLKRQAVLGARFDQLSATQKKEVATHGLYISGIMPNGTFDKIGLQKGMAVQEINGIKINSRSDLNKVMIPVMRAGDSINVLVAVNNTTKHYKGLATMRPKEVHLNAKVYYDEVQYKDNVLRSLLYIPKGVKNPPVVFYLQGYTCQSIEYSPSMPMKKLINDWIKSGFAVYLVEKPGIGDSDSKIKCSEINFPQELKAFSKAYKKLSENNKIDSDNIFLYGHSMGGVIAPILAQQIKPKGVLVFGTVGKKWYNYMKDVVTEQQMLFGSSKEQVTQNSKQSFPFLTDLMIRKKSNKEIIHNPLYNSYLKNQRLIGSLEKGYYLARHYTFWQTLGDIDIPKEWSKVQTNVYVMHGEYDVQAINYKYAKLIASNVNANKGKATFKIIPKTDHIFLKFSSMDENIKALTNGTYRKALQTNYNSEVARYSIEWMKKLIK